MGFSLDGALSHVIRSLKCGPLLAGYFLTLGKKHRWNQSRKCFRRPGLLVVQPKYWQLVFIFFLQGLRASSYTEKGYSFFFWPHDVARGILVPPPEIEPTSPALEGRFLTTGPPGKSPEKDSLDHKPDCICAKQ